MASPTTAVTFLEVVRKSNLLTAEQLDDLFGRSVPSDPNQCAAALVKAELLTAYQAKQLLGGKFRGFFLGPYKILKPIGQGGMGAVYLAEHTTLGRKVAVKVLTAEKAKDKLTLERFNREARAAAALDHPNIVRLHDISQGAGVHFLVMEYVEGNDLQSLMAQTGPLHYAQAAQYMAQAAAGLQHAHAKGFVHRDIKPANLILTKDGSVKILDMGLARSFTDSKDNLTALLADGDIAGTVDFLSPEQAMNHPLDERSDLYSLGATFYALVTGHPPFNGSTAQKLMQHQLKEPPSVTKKLNGRVPPALSDVISKMMAKRPSERYQTGGEVIDALGPWLPAVSTGNIVQDPLTLSEFRLPTSGGVNTPAPKGKLTKVGLKPVWKRPPVLIAAGVGLALLVGGLGLAFALGGNRSTVTTIDPIANVAPKGGNTRSSTTAGPPPAGTNPPPNGANTPHAAVVYRLDTSRLKPFRRRIDFDTSFAGANIRDEVPGWQYEVYDKGSDGEALVEIEDGRPVLAIGSRTGKNAAQFTFHPVKVGTTLLAAGREYEARVEYKTDGGVAGNAGVQTVNEWKIVGRASLPATAEWKTVPFHVTKPDGKEIQFTFGTTAVGSGFLKIRSFEIVDPTAGPVFRLSAADLPAFRNTKTGSQVTSGEQPSLGNGVYFHAHKQETMGEFFCESVDGQKALGWANLSGGASGQLGIELEGETPAAATPLTAGKKYRTRLVYKTVGGKAATYIQTYESWKIVDDQWNELPDTGGQWKTFEYDWTKPAEKVRMLVDNQASGPTAILYVREVTVSEVGGGTAAAPAVQPPAPLPPVGRSVARFDFASVAPFKKTFQDGMGDDGTTAFGFTDAVYGTCWKKESVAEFRCEAVDGTPAVGVTNLNDAVSSQIGVALKGTALQVGKRYVARVEYLTRNDAAGAWVVQRQDDYRRLGTAGLNGTGGKWATADVAFEAPADVTLVALAENTAVGEGNTLLVRRVEVFEAK